jgi:hypothetical protein
MKAIPCIHSALGVHRGSIGQLDEHVVRTGKHSWRGKKV